MGELVGIPEWLAVILCIAAIIGVLFSYAHWKHGRQLRSLAAKRPSPTQEEFISRLAGSADKDVASWMWAILVPYYKPLTPHPDDHLLRDAWIDDDDISLDWLPQFAKENGLRWQDWPDWPVDCELTVQNFAKWLQSGRDALQRP